VPTLLAANGSIASSAMLMAHLIAKGYSQIYGLDYYDVFDFQSAYLNGKLDPDEVIFMKLPPGLWVNGKFKNSVAC
jgi:hypothetical protein